MLNDSSSYPPPPPFIERTPTLPLVILKCVWCVCVCDHGRVYMCVYVRVTTVDVICLRSTCSAKVMSAILCLSSSMFGKWFIFINKNH